MIAAVGNILYLSILTFSGIAAGGAIVLLFAPHDTGLTGRDWLDRIALDASRLGFAIMVVLISEAVSRTPNHTLDPSQWRVWVYLAGAVLAGTGYLTLVVRGFLRHRKEHQ